MYFADWGTNTVRRIDTAGIITTVAGTGVPGFSGDCGPAVAAQLSQPYGLALHDGALYIGDEGNHRIRVVLLAPPAVADQPPSLPLTFTPGSIAFTRGGSLYVAAADGSDQVKVAQGDLKTHQISAFGFAPSRRALAFASDRDAELVFVAPDGRTLGSRALGPNTLPWSSWAPDGDRLVMSLAAARPELSIVGLDGQVMRTLALPDGFRWGWLPDLGSWSPDGRWIAVFGCTPPSPCDIKFDPHILLVAADGSGWHWLENSVSGYLAREGWTPDSRLELGKAERGSSWEIVALAADGSEIGRTSLANPGGTPVWSPDGTAWVSASGYALVSGTEALSHPVTIHGSPPSPARPDDIITDVGWSADGRDLLFVGHADASPVRSLYAIDPQGGTPRLLIEGVDEGFDVASAR